MYEIIGEAGLQPPAFKTNSANALARWLHATAANIRDTCLLVEADRAEREEHETLAREEAALREVEEDLARLCDAREAHFRKLSALEMSLRMARIHKSAPLVPPRALSSPVWCRCIDSRPWSLHPTRPRLPSPSPPHQTR